MSYFYKKNPEEIKKSAEEHKIREEGFEAEKEKKNKKKNKFIIIC